MTVPFVAFALLLAVLLMFALLKTNPATLAGVIRLLGPVLLGIFGLGLLMAGRAGVGGLLLAGAAGWYGAVRKRLPQKRSRGQQSSVRSAALEMTLDHDTGALEGVVLAGRFEGRPLGGMTLEELLELYGELAKDEESLQLLEAYLDGKFPVWRERTNAHNRDGQRSPPRTGRMTKEEAYQILGLETGAPAADIRKAHRRLMQRLHPDLGGSSFLAARINEARDILLHDHD